MTGADDHTQVLSQVCLILFRIPLRQTHVCSLDASCCSREGDVILMLRYIMAMLQAAKLLIVQSASHQPANYANPKGCLAHRDDSNRGRVRYA